MASSSYYHDLYLKKKKEVKNYDEDLEDLNKILKSLVYNLNDEINAVNSAIEELGSDLNKSVRHNINFTKEVNSLKEKKEKSIDLDKYLSNSKDAIEDEIAKINRLRTEAIDDRNYYNNKYLEKKEYEKEEARKAAEELLKKIF